MMKDLSTWTMEQLLARRDVIIGSCAGWLRTTDGSYEVALHNAGLTDIDAEIKRRKVVAHGIACCPGAQVQL